MSNEIEEDALNDSPLESTIVISQKSNVIPIGSVQVPFWSVVLGSGFIVYLSIIFVAACSSLLNSRRPGLHGEDCIRRSCESSLGLKCINSTCICPSDQYYLLKCQTKKGLGDSCHNIINNCQSGLICFNGKCGCNKGSTWNGKKCVSKGTYGDYCNQIECDDTKSLFCDSATKICSCDSTSRFWSGYSCMLKRSNNEKCVKNSDCKEDFGLVCSNGNCQCANTATHYFDVPLSACLEKKTFSSFCVSSDNCRNDLGLTCISDECVCGLSSPYWSSLKGACIDCPTGWTTKSGYCYYLNSNDFNWIDAYNWCASYGGTLPNFFHSNDYDFFENEFPSEEVWIGLRLLGGKWLWSLDNSTFYDPSNILTRSSWWETSEPSPGDDCGRAKSGFEIYGRPCHYLHEFLCQII